MGTFTRKLYPSPIGREYVEHEIRTFIILAIRQARDDVLFGITDNAPSEADKPMVRADALTFFTDGRYPDYLEMAGVHSDSYPMGVGLWVSRFIHYLGGSNPDIINRAMLDGILLEPDVWQDARDKYYNDVEFYRCGEADYDGKIGTVQLDSDDWSNVYTRLVNGSYKTLDGEREIVPWLWGKYAFEDKFPSPALIKAEWYGQLELQFEELGVISERSITRFGKDFFRRLAED